MFNIKILVTLVASEVAHGKENLATGPV